MRGIRALEPADGQRLAALLTQSWGSTRMATRGRLVDVTALPGFLAEDDGEWLGYVNYEVRDGQMEIVGLEAKAEGQGVASALLARCIGEALSADAHRVWLVTTNDNITALRFYQRRGFVLIALHPGAVVDARESIKPEIPLTGEHDIPLRDELELQLPHPAWPDFVDRYGWPTT